MQYAEGRKIIQQHGAASIIAALQPYVTILRQQRIDDVIASRIKSIQLALEAPADINNALAAVRTCEGLGISKVHIICPEADARFARSVTQGAVYWVEVLFYDSLDAFIRVAQDEGLQCAGGVINATMPLSEVPVEQPLCIMVGNEQRGLSSAAERICGIQYKIPMYGMTESYNLSVSAAISLYEVTQRKRKMLACNSDLETSDCERLRAYFYMNSLAPRLALALIKQLL